MNLDTKTIISFFKFGLVGGLGTLTNLAFFYVMVDNTHSLHHQVAVVIGFLIAVTQNYILNSIWTFKKKSDNSEATSQLNLKNLLKYTAINGIGLLLNMGIVEVVLYLFTLPLYAIAQAVGIGGAFVFNFLFSKMFVFK